MSILSPLRSPQYRRLWISQGISSIGNQFFVVTPPDRLGRVMSLLMLSPVGFAPLAAAAGGFVAEISVSALFLLAGALSAVAGVTGAWVRQRASTPPPASGVAVDS